MCVDVHAYKLIHKVYWCTEWKRLFGSGGSFDSQRGLSRTYLLKNIFVLHDPNRILKDIIIIFFPFINFGQYLTWALRT